MNESLTSVSLFINNISDELSNFSTFAKGRSKWLGRDTNPWPIGTPRSWGEDDTIEPQASTVDDDDGFLY
jgi:hypothetical protein